MTEWWLGYATGAASAVCTSFGLTLVLALVIRKRPPR
jgi:hypothetical protein